MVSRSLPSPFPVNCDSSSRQFETRKQCSKFSTDAKRFSRKAGKRFICGPVVCCIKSYNENMLLMMMKKEIVSKLTFCLFILIVLVIQNSYAVKSFAGSNLYYAAGLSIDQQKNLFSQLQSAGVKVLRVWLDGEKISSFMS